MPFYALGEHQPEVHPDAFIAPTATLIGRVFVDRHASIWYGAVVRGDFEEVHVGAGANVQDNSVVHCGLQGLPVSIGAGTTIGHLCTIHGCRIGEEALIGNGTTVLDGATIGARTLVAAGSLVLPNAHVPPGVLAVGTPADVKGPLQEPAASWVRENPERYRRLAEHHSTSIYLVR